MGISITDSSRRSSMLGLPMITSGAPSWVSNIPSMAANAGGWWRATLCAERSPVGKIISTQRTRPATTPIRSDVRANSTCRPSSR